MPRWLGHLVSYLRRKRLVRLHLISPGDRPAEMTVEGFLVGKWSGCYILERAKVLVDTETTNAFGGPLEIPKERVFFTELLAKDGRA
jgi:hypothetical protein